MGIELDKNEYSEKEDIQKIYFDAREWSFDKDFSETNKGERTFITSFDGTLVEAYSIGSWSEDEMTAISTRQLILKQNTDYMFSFWLNGGENSNQSEICQLEIIFNNDNENRRIYKLNRNLIKPLKYHKGWLLFGIPFSTEQNEFTQLKFIVRGAIMTVIPALDKEAYVNLSDDVQQSVYPMRYNIAFKNGYPDDIINPKLKNPFENVAIPSFPDIFNLNKQNNAPNVNNNADENNQNTAPQSPIIEKLKNTADAFDSMANEIANECSDRIRESLKRTIFGDSKRNNRNDNNKY